MRIRLLSAAFAAASLSLVAAADAAPGQGQSEGQKAVVDNVVVLSAAKRVCQVEVNEASVANALSTYGLTQQDIRPGSPWWPGMMETMAQLKQYASSREGKVQFCDWAKQHLAVWLVR